MEHLPLAGPSRSHDDVGAARGGMVHRARPPAVSGRRMEAIGSDAIPQQGDEVAGVKEMGSPRRDAFVVHGVAAEKVQARGLVGHFNFARTHSRFQEVRQTRRRSVRLERMRENLVEKKRGRPVFEKNIGGSFGRRDGAGARGSQPPQTLAELLEGAIVRFGQMKIEAAPFGAAPGVREHLAVHGDTAPRELVRTAGSADDEPRRSKAAHIHPVGLGRKSAAKHRPEFSHPACRIGELVGGLFGISLGALRICGR